jgi:peptidyl-prolyl cis-trans isomerase D
MLQTLRDKLTGLVAVLFLGAIAIVFVFWGIDFQAGAITYAAKVEGERIPVETVRRAWQQQLSRLQQMFRDELPDELKKSQQKALLDQFIRETLLTQKAREDGYRVSDEALARRLMEFPAFQVDGKFSKDRYIAVLRSSGLTEAGFEANVENEMLVNQLVSSVTESAFVTPREVERRYVLNEQEREVNYALIPAGEFTSSVTVTDEQIQKHYEENKDDYLLPEAVDLQYVELTRAQAESNITVDEKELRDYYESVKERFTSPERRRARHILITTEDGVDDAQARKTAEELADKAKAGADFAQLAREHSKDPGSAQQGGDLGWAQRGMFVGPFEDALFSMTPGEIRGPVKTQFGYHVIKLDEVEPGSVRTFEQARAEVEEEYRRERAQTIFQDQADKLEDLAFSTLTELESVAAKMNLPLKTIQGFTREGGGELGQYRDVIEAAFSEEVLQQGQNSPLIALGEDRAVVLRVTNHKPAEPRPLAEVRAQIEARLKVQAARDAAAKKGAEVLAQLEQGKSWEEVAKALSIQPVGQRFIGRDDAIAPSAVVRAAFEVPRTAVSKEKPFLAGVTTDDGNYAVYAVTAVRDPDPAQEPQKDKEARTRQLQVQLGNAEFAAYLSEAERRADVDRNERVFE